MCTWPQAAWAWGYWVPDMSIQCYTGWHLRIALALGAPMLLICSIGIPLLPVWLLFSQRRNLDSLSTKLRLGFLYKPYWYSSFPAPCNGSKYTAVGLQAHPARGFGQDHFACAWAGLRGVDPSSLCPDCIICCWGRNLHTLCLTLTHLACYCLHALPIS